MSKLQKKKPVSEKKRQKADVEIDSSGSAGSAAPAKKVSSVSTPKGVAGKTVAEPGTGNLFTRSAEFLREVKVELKKVTWPTRKQTTGTTIVVIFFVFVVAAFLGLFDYSLSRLVQVVLT